MLCDLRNQLHLNIFQGVHNGICKNQNFMIIFSNYSTNRVSICAQLIFLQGQHLPKGEM